MRIIGAMWVLLAILGLGVGVGVNSLADNLPPDADGVRHKPRRPRCRHCGRPHRPVFWLVAASYLLEGGRCEHCGAGRALRGVAVEAVMAASLPLVWAWAVDGGPVTLGTLGQFLAAAAIVTIFVLITVIDIEHRLILRIVVLPSVLLVAFIGSIDPGRGVTKTLVGGAVGFGIMYAVFLLAEVYTWVQTRLRGQPMDEVAFGGGDVNLAAVVGCVVGWPGVLLALMLAIFAGAAYSLTIVIPQLIQRRYSPHSVIPYGPFLVLGAILIYFFGADFAAYYAANWR